MNWWCEQLRCPTCGADVERRGGSLFCLGARSHCFDFSAKGHVNLAPANASGGGDDATLIAARTAFLSGGHYAPVADKILSLLSRFSAGHVVVDAGCGEGYYTAKMAEGGYSVLAFDLSKRGVMTTAATTRTLPVLAAVAGVFTLPLKDDSVDAVVSLFAPVAEEEFLRVLKPHGVLIMAGAGSEHLMALKRVLYDTPVKNAPRADEPKGMALLCRESLQFDMQLTGDEARSLFAMTPYYYRTPRAGQERLAALTSLVCGAHVDFAVLQRQADKGVAP